ncbi:hypothetical protein [Brucella anthropi]
MLMAFYIIGAKEEANSAEQPSNFNAPKAVDQFLEKNKACIAIDDGCITCAVNGSELVCSTPRIACVPRELDCTLALKPNDDDGRKK